MTAQIKNYNTLATLFNIDKIVTIHFKGKGYQGMFEEVISVEEKKVMMQYWQMQNQ